jgi:hypothetical protein
MLKKYTADNISGACLRFWVSPNFKTIVAVIAIFRFGMLSLEDGFRVFYNDDSNILTSVLSVTVALCVASNGI